MRITAIHVGVSKTVNLGNFNSIRVEASLTAEPGEGEDPAEVKGMLQAQLKELIEQTYRAQRKENGEGQRPALGANGEAHP